MMSGGSGGGRCGGACGGTSASGRGRYRNRLNGGYILCTQGRLHY